MCKTMNELEKMVADYRGLKALKEEVEEPFLFSFFVANSCTAQNIFSSPVHVFVSSYTFK